MSGLGMRITISSISTKFNRVPNINTETLDKWIRTKEEGKDVVIWDCRPEEEYVVSHIAGAVRVDYQNDAQKILGKLPSKDLDNKTVVCYCSVGYRSSLVVEKVQEYYKKTGDESGTTPVEMYNLEGSLFKWANEGRPMINVNNAKTPYAHPYNPVFGKLLNSSLRREKVQDT